MFAKNPDTCSTHVNYTQKVIRPVHCTIHVEVDINRFASPQTAVTTIKWLGYAMQGLGWLEGLLEASELPLQPETRFRPTSRVDICGIYLCLHSKNCDCMLLQLICILLCKMLQLEFTVMSLQCVCTICTICIPL